MRAAELNIELVPEDIQPDFWLSARDIAKLVNPMASPPWFGVDNPITLEEVSSAIRDKSFVYEHLGAGDSDSDIDGIEEKTPCEIRRLHIGRIAAFVQDMPEDAICIGVGMPSLGHDIGENITVDDGNHRLAAAIYLDTDIRTTFTGEWEEFQRLFPDAKYCKPHKLMDQVTRKL